MGDGECAPGTHNMCFLCCPITCFLRERYRLAFIIHCEMFAIFTAEEIFAACRQKVILYKMFVRVQQSLFLLQEQRNNETP